MDPNLVGNIVGNVLLPLVVDMAALEYRQGNNPIIYLKAQWEFSKNISKHANILVGVRVRDKGMGMKKW